MVRRKSLSPSGNAARAHAACCLRHQDQSYYPSSIPDTRAANVWLALEDVTVEMGCMQFKSVPLESRKLLPHRPAGNGKGALTLGEPPAEFGETTLCPLKAGDVVVFANCERPDRVLCCAVRSSAH